MKQGDIILIPFPFTDLAGNKLRPALTLIVTEFDITVNFLTTQVKWKSKSDVLLIPDKYNGLKKPSLVRTSKLATIDRSLAIGKIGSISEENYNDVINNLFELLKKEKAEND
ncbi:MAG: type II toxin-antitoxin system PemK/MazF family toxin [Candidatus Cyclobacteriaceae bacterium M2_1C_046]